MADFNFSELDRLAADLGDVPKQTGPLIRKAIEVSSLKVKKSAADSVKSGSRMWKALPRTIDYDILVAAGLGGSSITSEVGYNKDQGAGHLGNLREYGAPGKNLAPHNDLKTALEANQDDFERGLSIAIEQAERAAGL